MYLVEISNLAETSRGLVEISENIFPEKNSAADAGAADEFFMVQYAFVYEGSATGFSKKMVGSSKKMGGFSKKMAGFSKKMAGFSKKTVGFSKKMAGLRYVW